MAKNKLKTIFKDSFHIRTLIISITISVIWVLCSDYLVHVIFGRMEMLQILQNFKGIASMVCFSLVLSWVHKREKKAQEVLLLQTRMTSLGQLSASVVHEMNNPLQVFSIGLEKIRQDHNNPNELEITLKKIETSLDRLQTTIDVLSRLSRNELVDTYVKTDVAELIRDAKEFTGHRFENKSITCAYTGEKSIKALGHPGLLTHLFLNLFSNALDAVKKDGWIKVHGEIVKGNTVRIVFENSGPPISQDYAEKIFLPFFTTKEKGKGTGLGLFFSRKIAEIHQGQLYYDQKAEHPRFILELPILRVI